MAAESVPPHGRKAVPHAGAGDLPLPAGDVAPVLAALVGDSVDDIVVVEGGVQPLGDQLSDQAPAAAVFPADGDGQMVYILLLLSWRSEPPRTRQRPGRRPAAGRRISALPVRGRRSRGKQRGTNREPAATKGTAHGETLLFCLKKIKNAPGYLSITGRTRHLRSTRGHCDGPSSDDHLLNFA